MTVRFLNPMSIALAGLRSPAGLREQVEWAAALGPRGITLNGALPGGRARELTRSARRDLAALLRRLELNFHGIDLWIPPAHFADPREADRAMAAAFDALALTAELADLAGSGHAVLSMELPQRDEGRVAAARLAECAAASRVQIADHAWPPRDRPAGQKSRVGGGGDPLGVGIDPAGVMLAGALGGAGAVSWSADPAAAVTHLGDAVAVARLSDLGSGGRAPLGTGRLDQMAYAAALSAISYQGPLVIDLRGVLDPAFAAQETLRTSAVARA